MLTLIITLIETVYTFLWGDPITLPLPGGGTLGLPLLVLLLIPGVGHESNGAVRWLGVGGLTIMPGEIAKIALSLFVA